MKYRNIALIKLNTTITVTYSMTKLYDTYCRVDQLPRVFLSLKIQQKKIFK